MADCDVLVMPVSPIQAPQFGQFEAKIDGSNLPMRLLLARFVQPLALLGYPIVVVPVSGIDGPPVGVQLMGRPFEEDKVLRAAAWLEAKGVARSDVAPAFREG
jgi:Asp-tRNA(Asn)/Glu-tRNA(Gln) amidotransferase A subunit family amidase